MMVSNSVAGIVECIISYVDYFFPDGMLFIMSLLNMAGEKKFSSLSAGF